MSTAPTEVLNCPCNHKPAPQGSNEVCQYAPPATCGGTAHCAICRGSNPPVSELPPPIGGTQPPPQPQPLNLPATDSGESSGEWHGIPIDDV